jgi:hypothetical protein
MGIPVLCAAVAAALALAVPGAADVPTSPPTIPEFTGWISGSNVIFHWYTSPGTAQVQLLRDGTVIETLSAATHEWLLPVKTSRGHGFQVRALDAAGTPGPATFERLSPLPALRGKKLAAADAALKAAGFKPGTILSYRTYGAKGIVIDVRTRGVVPLGWQVGFMVSR